VPVVGSEKNPLISVVMPVWNGARYLSEAIESVLSQTFVDFEFIIIDDGSTDSTLQIIISYEDPRLRVFQTEHRGIVTAMNFGIQKARTEWIARLDADDICHPRRFEFQWKALKDMPGAVMCYTDVEFIGDRNFFPPKERLPQTKALLAFRMCYECPIIHSTVFFNKKAFLKVGAYIPTEEYAEDYSLWGRLIHYGTFLGLPEKLVKFRIHGFSISKQKRVVQHSIAKVLSAKHCLDFMGMSSVESERLYSTMMKEKGGERLIDWIWLISNCALRLRWHSSELWIWLMYRTVKRLVGI
jgi:glycosyltransferase involved in cell wall biosynthesis